MKAASKTFIPLLLILLLLASCADGDSSLDALDSAVMDNSDAVMHRRSIIDSLRALSASPLNPSDRFDVEMKLSRFSKDFNIDSALVHVNRALRYSDKDSPRHIEALLNLASIYNSSLLMYKEASDIFNSLDPDMMPDSLRSEYYTLGVQIYRNLEEQSSLNALAREYREIKMAYRDSVLQINGESPFILANKLADEGKYDEAIEIFAKDIRGDDYSPANGAVYHQLANLYSLRGDRENAKLFLRLAALADLDNGVREYKALPQLALLLYEDGDINRAYTYIHRAYDDAKLSNARIRLLELSSVMPIVDSAHEMAQKNATRTLLIILIAILVIALLLIEGLSIVRRQNRRLRSAREDLLEANRSLTDANAVKEKYVTQFMHLSLDYLGKMERYRAELYKLATQKDWNRLTAVIDSGRYINSEMEDFYKRFDDAFLDLYPDFVNHLNSLLRDDAKVTLKSGEKLNTELRIFALMKLGITEGDMIARFLRCSPSTIYNYRTKIRNRAKNRATFDADVIAETAIKRL